MRLAFLLYLLAWLQLVQCHSVNRRGNDDNDDDDDDDDDDDSGDYDHEWPDLSSARAVGLRAQRDVSIKDIINRQSLFGIDLTPVLFELEGYNIDAMNSFRSLLNVGSQVVIIDLYYNENTKFWQLCPFAIPKDIEEDDSYYDTRYGVNCSANFAVSHLLNTINAFFLDTQKKYSVNILYFMMRLHSIRSDYASASPSYGSNSLLLGEQLSTHISENKIMMPYKYSASNLPTLTEFLFKDYHRLVPIVLENNLYENTTYNITKDYRYIYFKDINIDVDMVPFDELVCANDAKAADLETTIYNATLVFSYDTGDKQFTPDSFRDSISCGVSAILSHSFNDTVESISSFLPYSMWSWGPWKLNRTPTLITDNNTETTNDNINGDSGELYRCAVIRLDANGWTTSEHCTQANRVACLNRDNETDWKLTNGDFSFFSASSACRLEYNRLSSYYAFSVPPSPRSQAALLSVMSEELDDSDSVWIDLNSLHTSNCWVTGGAKVTCPYEKVITTRMFEEMITPTSVIAFILLVIMILLHFVSFPVQRNRKYWRKVLAEHSKKDYEGVPA